MPPISRRCISWRGDTTARASSTARLRSSSGLTPVIPTLRTPTLAWPSSSTSADGLWRPSRRRRRGFRSTPLSRRCFATPPTPTCGSAGGPRRERRRSAPSSWGMCPPPTERCRPWPSCRRATPRGHGARPTRSRAACASSCSARRVDCRAPTPDVSPARMPNSANPTAPTPGSGAAGLTAATTSGAGGVQRLQISRPSRDAARRLRDTVPAYLVAVGRVLRVRYLVEGSVRRAGARVRVSVRLVKAANGFRIWGEDYDRATSDLLVLQEAIAREVATGIAGRLVPTERAALAARPTRNPEAFERFLRGNYYLTQRTPSSVARAIEEYQAAVKLDPEFTSALARMARGYAAFLGAFPWDYGGAPPESLLARAFAADDQALRYDPNSSDAWMAKAALLSVGDPRAFERARVAFERAIALDPSNAEAHHGYAAYLRLLGDDSAAATAYHRALAIEPQRAISLQVDDNATNRRILEEMLRSWRMRPTLVDG